MTDQNENDPLESLIQQCALSQPSRALDFRIHSLIATGSAPNKAPRYRLLVPFLSFAAGILLTCAILLPFKFAQAATTPIPTNPTTPTPTTFISKEPSTPALAANSTPVQVIAQPHQSTEEISATLNGIPIQLQTTRTQYITYPANSPAARISLCDYYTISPARRF
jgi:hypothetical protein